MYQDVITVFNRMPSRLGDMWYPTILRNVNLNIDRATVVQNYGENSADNCILNVHYTVENGVKKIGKKTYLLPKEWGAQVNESASESITFKSGENFDFFVVGEHDVGVVDDSDYIRGFYDYMRNKYDQVYAVSTVSDFSIIPHLQITGR